MILCQLLTKVGQCIAKVGASVFTCKISSSAGLAGSSAPERKGGLKATSATVSARPLGFNDVKKAA